MHLASVKTAGKDLPDSELARRIAAGDQEAVRVLMRRYNQTLYRTAHSILKDDDAVGTWPAPRQEILRQLPRGGTA